MMVDSETGELLEGFPILQRQSGKHYWEANFVVNFQESLKETARRLSGAEARVLLYLLGTVGMNNEWNLLNQREIGEDIEMHQQQVSLALKNLSEKQILIKGARIGKSHAYSLNPNLGWRGPFRNHAPAKHQAPHIVVRSRELTAA
jgi:hypothetical protein